MITPRRIAVRYPTRRSVLASFRADAGKLSLFVPTATAAEIGEQVTLDIELGDCPNRFELKGKVTWRRAAARGVGQDVGLGVSFNGEEKWVAAQMFAFCAGRPVGRGTAGDNRIPIRIPVRIKAGKKSFPGEVFDLSISGVFVGSPGLRKIPLGYEVDIQLEPKWMGLVGKWLKAKVVWMGEKQGSRGFGARFIGSSMIFKSIIKKYLPDEMG